MAEVTKLLHAIQEGDRTAEAHLLAVIYGELTQLAAGAMTSEASDCTLSATALVHEAYLRLVDDEGRLAFENRRHFFGAAAQAMRRILVDAARSRRRTKRGGDRDRVELNDVAAPDADARLVELDEALAELARRDPLAAQVVELRRFAGLSHEQIGAALDVSVYEARQKWTFARAWLKDALK